jgi:hypothetical protein
MPVRLLNRLGLFRLIADMLWSYLNFRWGYQFYATRFGPCRRHVGCVEPVVIAVSDIPVGFSPFALSEFSH